MVSIRYFSGVARLLCVHVILAAAVTSLKTTGFRPFPVSAAFTYGRSDPAGNAAATPDPSDEPETAETRQTQKIARALRIPADMVNIERRERRESPLACS